MRIEVYGNNYVIREGNEKMTFFIHGDPYAHITARVLFLKYAIEVKSPIAGVILIGMEQFAKDYKGFYDNIIVSRDAIDFLTICI